VLAYYGDNSGRVCAYVANAKPTLPADPFNDYPRPSTEAYIWICEEEEFFLGAYGNIRNYFSGCATDGSFIFLRTSLSWSPTWRNTQQFHVLDANDPQSPDEMPMRAAVLMWAGVGATNERYRYWRVYAPIGGLPFRSPLCPYGWGYYSGKSELDLYSEDYLRQTMLVYPMTLGRYGGGYTTVTGYSGYPVGRVPDVFIHPDAAASEGDQAPATGTPKYISAGAFWFPGSVVPVFT
jgi:hypothetical protein